MPRRMTDDLTFERHCGHVSILLEAIELCNGKEWVQHTLRPGVLEPSRDFYESLTLLAVLLNYGRFPPSGIPPMVWRSTAQRRLER
jgi:hypothetical protein